jgi:hypothetical protein
MSKAKLICRKCNVELVPGKNWYNARICHKCARIETTRRYRATAIKTGNPLAYTVSKSCPLYLGCHIAEKVLKRVFNNVEMMPMMNAGFDFICNHGKKIDVKSACLSKGKYPTWGFHIDHNKLADYFLCLAFDNRNDLNPLYLWLIPGHLVNNHIQIGVSPSTVSKWDEFALGIDGVTTCCDNLKNPATQTHAEPRSQPSPYADT